MANTVKIRYIGPQTEGLWTAHPEHGAFDFDHHEYVEVPVGLAADLMAQLEPVPPGEPIVVGYDEAGESMYETKLAPVWELEPGATLPAPPAAESEASKAKPPAKRRATSSRKGK